MDILQKLGMNALGKKIGIASIVENMEEFRLRKFEHVCWRQIEAPIRRVDHMEVNLTARGRQR